MDYLKMVEEFHKTFGHPVGENIQFPSKTITELRLRLLAEELDELKEAIEKGDFVGVADALGDLQYILSGTVLVFGLQNKFNEVFQEIQNSNMSKLGEDGKPIYREDGKVLKGPNYFPPNIEGILTGEHKPKT